MFQLFQYIKALFTKSSYSSPPLIPAEDIPEMIPEDIEDLSQDMEKITKEAYIKIISSIDASEIFKAKIFKMISVNEAYLADLRSPQAKAAQQVAIQEDWIWQEYDTWFNKFSQRNEWPGSWNSILYTEPDSYPDTVEGVLPLFTVPEMKAFLKNNGLMPKPIPKKREDFQDIMCQKAQWEMLKPLVSAKHTPHLFNYETKRKIAKFKLLHHYFIQTIYGLVRYYQVQEILNDHIASKISGLPKAKISTGYPPTSFDSEYVSKFNSNEITEYPPYFPGCQVQIFCLRKNKRI